MKVFASVFVLGLMLGGMSHAAEGVTAARYMDTITATKGSHWYCVSESPSNMQSSGHIGYGHGSTREEAARQAIEDCGRDGGFGCGAPECFPE